MSETQTHHTTVNVTKCSICLCEIEPKSKITLTCNHSFCIDCIKQIRNPICPYCRAPIEPTRDAGLTGDDINNMKNKRSEDKRENERLPPHLRNQLPAFLVDLLSGGFIPDIVIGIIPPRITQLYNRLNETYDIIINDVKNSVQRGDIGRPLMNTLILTTLNAVRVVSIIHDGNTDGVNDLVYDRLLKDLPIIYPIASPEYIQDRLLSIITQ